MKKKRLKEIDDQLDYLMEAMKSVPLDSDEYKKLHEQYASFLEEAENLKKSGKGFDRVMTLLGFVVTCGGTFVMPMWLANKATRDDDEMKLPIHRVLNLIGKKL